MVNSAGTLGGTTNGPLREMDGWNLPEADRGPSDTGIDDIDFTTSPTAIQLADLWARGYDATVLVEWRTAQEVDNLGFNVYRSRFPDRDWVQVNPGMILGMGDSQAGGRY
ncbi:MAG: hypothetical protein HY720_32170, partial [Planctomycetes bacterium]|nr:hypothetical protein [Planctomycetota bacterium]